MKQDTLLKYLLEDVLKKTNEEVASELITHVDTESDSIEVFQKPIKVTDTEYLIKKEHINTFQCYFELKFEDELNIGKIINIEQLHADVFRITLKEEERVCPPHKSNTNLELEKAMGLNKEPAEETIKEEPVVTEQQPPFQGDYLQNIINNAKAGASSVPKEAFVEKTPIGTTLPPVSVDGEGTGVESNETFEDIIGGEGSNINQQDLPGWGPKTVKKETFEDLPETPINLGATGTGAGLESIEPKSAEPGTGFDVRKLVLNTEKTTQGQPDTNTQITPPVTPPTNPPVNPTPEVKEHAYRIYVGKGENYAGFDLPENIEERTTSINNVMMSAFQAGEDVCVPINNALDFLQSGNIPLVINDQALLTKIADPELGESPCLRLEFNEGHYDIAVVKN